MIVFDNYDKVLGAMELYKRFIDRFYDKKTIAKLQILINEIEAELALEMKKMEKDLCSPKP